MSFRVLGGSLAAAPVVDLGFVVTSRGKGVLSLRMAIGAAIMKQMSWSETTLLHLLVDEDAGLGQLQAVLSRGRKMQVNSIAGRGECFFRYTEDEELFFSQYQGLCELTITTADPLSDSVTFELPEVDPPEPAVKRKKRGGAK